MSMLTWWLLGNSAGGVHRTRAAYPKQAREHIREGIADAGMSEGMSKSAARRYAHTFNVYVIAGWCTQEEVQQAAAAWEANDLGPADALRARYLEQGGERRQR